jgi:tetratricopeptide (TPR) repeat protein
MYCPGFEGPMGEYALDGGAELAPEERERVEAHLAECPSCREEFEGEKALYAKLRRAHRYVQSIQPPAAEVGELKRRVRAALRKREIARLAAKIAAGLTGLAAAVVLSVSLLSGGNDDGKSLPPIAAPPSPPEHIKPIVSSGPPRLPKPQEARPETAEHPKQVPFEVKKEICRLRDRFRAEKGEDADPLALAEIARATAEIATRYPGTREEVEALRIVFGCRERAGDADEAYDAFEAYVDGVERVKGRERAAEEASGKGQNEFVRKEHLKALYYFDLAAKRYPDTERGQFAMFKRAECYQKLEDPEAALAELELLADRYPESKWAERACTRIPDFYFNFQEREMALRAYEEFMERYPTEDNIAYARFHMGMMKDNPYDQARMLAALEDFRFVAEKHPDHRYARDARGMIELIRRRIARAAGDDLMNGL